MEVLALLSHILLWLAVLVLGFLLVGVLGVLGRVNWRLEQTAATTPSRLGRDGLRPGAKAPDFTLLNVEGIQGALHDFAGQQVLLVFLQAGCGPCTLVLPELARLARRSRPRVLAVFNGDADSARRWANEHELPFPVMVQVQWSVSRRYQTFATPFAFLIDESGVIAAKGIVNNRQHIRLLLAEARNGSVSGHVLADVAGTERDEP